MEGASHRGAYLATFAALLILLAVTVGVAHIPLGLWSPVAAMGIAAVKTTLIALVFMHLQQETSLVRVFSLAGLMWLTILLALLTSDYLTRTGVSPAEGRL